MKLGLGVFIAALAVYFATLHPSIPGGDSGELILIAWAGGVAHPPGYPLFSLLGYLASLVPLGTVGARVNFMNAFVAAAATGGLAMWVQAVAPPAYAVAAGILAAGLFAFDPIVWEHAVQAEVFAINHLFVVALLWIGLRPGQPWDRRRWTLFCGVFGLGLSNHHTLLFCGVPLAAFNLWSERRSSWIRDWKSWAYGAGAFACGFIPYLYLIWGAEHAPEVSWGQTSTWDGFWRHFFRAEYGTFQLGSEMIGVAGSLTLARTWLYFKTLAMGLAGPVGVLLAAGGVYRMTRERLGGGSITGRAIFVLTGMLVFYVVVFHRMSNLPIDNALLRGVQARFWQYPDLLVSALAGLGFGLLLQSGRSVPRQTALAVALGVVALNFGMHYAHRNHRQNRFVENYARSVLESLPPNAILLIKGDINTNSLRYVQFVEGVRRDVRLLDLEMMSYRWFIPTKVKVTEGVIFPGQVYHPQESGGFLLKQFLDVNIQRAPIYLVGGFKQGDDTHAATYALWPHGWVDQIIPKATYVDFKQWHDESLQAVKKLEGMPLPDAKRYDLETWEAIVRLDYWNNHHRRIFRILQLGIENQDARDLLELAATEFKELLRIHPDPPSYIHKNLGLAYYRMSIKAPEFLEQAKAAWRVYLKDPLATDRDVPAIRQLVGG